MTNLGLEQFSVNAIVTWLQRKRGHALGILIFDPFSIFCIKDQQMGGTVVCYIVALCTFCSIFPET